MAGEVPPAHHTLKSTNPYHVGYDQGDELKFSDDHKLYQSSPVSGTYLVKQPKVLVGVIPSGRDYMMWSILACIFCFMPTGIAAVYYANKAHNLVEEGSLVEAEYAQKRSNKFIVISVIIGSILLVITSTVIGLLYYHGHI